MKIDFKLLKKELLLPVILLITLLILVLFYKVFNLPTTEELVVTISRYFELYGYPVLFLSALIEAIPPINLYYPGSSIILLAAAFSRQGVLNIFAVILITSLAFVIAYSLNYYIGFRGYYHILKRFGFGSAINNARVKIDKYGNKWLWLTYFHPNFGAITATCYGIAKIPFKRFIVNSIIVILAWSTFWGVVCYISANQVIDAIATRWVVILILVLWIIYKTIITLKRM